MKYRDNLGWIQIGSIGFHLFAISAVVLGLRDPELRFEALAIHVCIWVAGYFGFSCLVYRRYLNSIEKRKRWRMSYFNIYLWILPIELILVGGSLFENGCWAALILASYVLGYLINPLAALGDKSLGVIVFRGVFLRD